MQRQALKQELAVLGAATEVGFLPDPAAAARIRTLAEQLEALNPTPEPARAISLLRGRWRLVYSNFTLQRHTTLARLSGRNLPPEPVEVTELYNEVDPLTGTYDNVVHFLSEEGWPGIHVMAGSYTPESDHDIDLAFTEAMLFGHGGPVMVPACGNIGESRPVRISYLDEGFRLCRGPYGSLYVLERLDPFPLRWARDG